MTNNTGCIVYDFAKGRIAFEARLKAAVQKSEPKIAGLPQISKHDRFFSLLELSSSIQKFSEYGNILAKGDYIPKHVDEKVYAIKIVDGSNKVDVSKMIDLELADLEDIAEAIIAKDLPFKTRKKGLPSEIYIAREPDGIIWSAFLGYG